MWVNCDQDPGACRVQRIAVEGPWSNYPPPPPLTVCTYFGNPRVCGAAGGGAVGVGEGGTVLSFRWVAECFDFV